MTGPVVADHNRPAAPGALPAALDGARSQPIDQWRGLAIVLMVLDHVLYVGDIGQPIRVTLTRASLPILMLLAGSLRAGRPGLGWVRFRDVAYVLAVTAPLALLAGLGLDPMLSVIAGLVLASLVYDAHQRWLPNVPGVVIGTALVVAGFTHQPYFWQQLAPVGITAGYSPIWCAGLAYLGTTLPRPIWPTLPRAEWLGAVGRFPRTVYGLHLLALLALSFGGSVAATLYQ